MRTALLTLLLLLPIPAHADEAPVRVLVDETLDAPALVILLSGELDTPVVAVDAGDCAAPCLVVDVADDGATAALTFTSVDDAWRARTIALPPDPSARLEMIVHLAGNLARDEAATLLAQLSPPEPLEIAMPEVEAPASAAPPREEIAVAYRAERREREGGIHFGYPLNLSIIPPLSADFVSPKRHAVSVSAAIGLSRGTDAISASGAIDVALGEVSGAQLGGAITVAPTVDGAQIAGAIAVAGRIRGAQLAGAVAVARDIDGVQIAGAINTARDVDGSQLAGAINVARDVDGLQLSGAINVARRARTQLGVVNVAGNPDVVSIGVLTFVRGGRTELDSTVTTDATGAVILRHGGRRWHNLYGLGGRRAGESDDTMLGATDDALWMYGLGMGGGWRRGRLAVDVEAMAWQVNHGTWHEDDLSLLTQLRLTAAWDLGSVAPIAGVVANGYVHQDFDGHRAVRLTTTTDLDGTDDARLTLWPSVFVGVRL
jgi:hypothetical protein